MKKKLMIFVLLSCLTNGIFAQSLLKVSLNDKAPITVSVDGRYFQKHGASITVGDMPPGTHYLKIFSYSTTRRGWEKEELLFEGRVKTKRNMVTSFVYFPENGDAEIEEHDINQYNATMPAEQEHRFDPTPKHNELENSAMNDEQINNNVPSGKPVASPVSKDQIITLTGEKIDKLKKKANGKPTDTEKLKVLKNALKNEKYNTNQVAEIMDWLIFESSRVELAKTSYGNVVDKDNYYNTLSGKFNYKDSQDELAKFINKWKSGSK